MHVPVCEMLFCPQQLGLWTLPPAYAFGCSARAPSGYCSLHRSQSQLLLPSTLLNLRASLQPWNLSAAFDTLASFLKTLLLHGLQEVTGLHFVLDCARHTPATGPLHWLFSLDCSYPDSQWLKRPLSSPSSNVILGSEAFLGCSLCPQVPFLIFFCHRACSPFKYEYSALLIYIVYCLCPTHPPLH